MFVSDQANHAGFKALDSLAPKIFGTVCRLLMSFKQIASSPIPKTHVNFYQSGHLHGSKLLVGTCSQHA
jgi:hypothetical protein